MKKSGVLAAAMVLLAPLAHAQGSVTIFGLMDAGMTSSAFLRKTRCAEYLLSMSA